MRNVCVIICLLACSSVNPRTMKHVCERTHTHAHAHEQLEDKAVSFILPSQYLSHTDYLISDEKKREIEEMEKR